jgi:hypothetical protein
MQQDARAVSINESALGDGFLLYRNRQMDGLLAVVSHLIRNSIMV